MIRLKPNLVWGLTLTKVTNWYKVKVRSLSQRSRSSLWFAVSAVLAVHVCLPVCRIDFCNDTALTPGTLNMTLSIIYKRVTLLIMRYNLHIEVLISIWEIRFHSIQSNFERTLFKKKTHLLFMLCHVSFFLRKIRAK